MKQFIVKIFFAACALTLSLAMFIACSSSENVQEGESEQTLRQKYSAACATIAEDLLELRISSSAPAASTFAVAASAEPEHSPASEKDLYTVRGVSAYIGLLGDMLNDASFLLTDKAVQFTASYENGTYREDFSASLAYSFDQNNDKIYMSWDVDSASAYANTKIFLYMDIDYDFTAGSLLGFHIKSVQTAEQSAYYFSYKYYDGALTVWNSAQNDYDAYFAAERSALQAKLPEAIDLNADYSAAYTNAMNRIQSVS